MNTIRKAAQGQQCTLNITGVCNHRPDTVTLCHFPTNSHGIDFQNADISAGFGCCACQDVINGRVNIGLSNAKKEFYMRRSQTRTLIKLIELGIIQTR